MKRIKLALSAVWIYLIFSVVSLIINNAALSIGMASNPSSIITAISIVLLCTPPILFLVISFFLWKTCRRLLPQHPLFPFILHIVGILCSFLPYWLIMAGF